MRADTPNTVSRGVANMLQFINSLRRNGTKYTNFWPMIYETKG